MGANKISGSAHETRVRSLFEVSRHKTGNRSRAQATVNKIATVVKSEDFDLYFTLAVMRTVCLFTGDVTTAVVFATNDDVV